MHMLIRPGKRCYHLTVVPYQLIRPSRCFDKPITCTYCCQSCKMSNCNKIFNNCGDLEIFSVVTGSLSLLLVVVLLIIVAYLSITLGKLQKQMTLQSRLDQHSFNNPAIQPNEELGVRGFSMFRGQEDSRAPISPQRDDYPKNINPRPQPPADRAPYMQGKGKEEFFGNFGNEPQQGRYVY